MEEKSANVVSASFSPMCLTLCRLGTLSLSPARTHSVLKTHIGSHLAVFTGRRVWKFGRSEGVSEAVKIKSSVSMTPQTR